MHPALAVVALGAVGGATVAAEVSSSSSADAITGLLQYGVLGIVLLLFIMGKIVPGNLLDQRDKEILKLQEEVADHRQREFEQMLPALLEYNRIVAEILRTYATRPGGFGGGGTRTDGDQR